MSKPIISIQRGLAFGICLILRILGTTLAVFMILTGSMIGWSWSAHPPAQYFISEWPNAPLLFGWFLLPYSRIQAKWLWGSCFICLCGASTILVHSALSISQFYSERESVSQSETLFLIGLSLVTCFSQPLVVLCVRFCELNQSVSSKEKAVKLVRELLAESTRQHNSK